MEMPLRVYLALSNAKYRIGSFVRRIADRFDAPEPSVFGAPMNLLLHEAAHRCQEGECCVLQHPSSRVLVTALQYGDETHYREAADAAKAALTATSYRAVGQTTENPT